MRISTWNMQGRNYNNDCSSFAEAKNRMLNQNIDVFCLQECGDLQKINGLNWELSVSLSDHCVYKANIQIGSISRGVNCNIYFLRSGNANFRCSMAIIVRAELDRQMPAIIIPNVKSKVRPIFGVLLTANVAVYNIHAPSGAPELAHEVRLSFKLCQVKKKN